MKRILTLALIVVAMLALAAAPALAEGYNVDPDGDGSQGYYTRANGYFSGPHGGYNSTTNKCQECHSTHYASGSYMLLRVNSREAACDYCHVGGGGSSINIQMDNSYNADGVDMSAVGDTDVYEGMGTGHTLGYTGNAPVDIKPAYRDSNGFACFDCHTPHGNSARVLTTFANPGRAFEPNTNVVAVMAGPTNDVSALFEAEYGVNPDGTYNIGIATDIDFDGNGDDDVVWGLTKTEGNIVLQKSDGKPAMKKPIWPTGRFLLLKNPHDELQEDTVVIDETAFEVAGDDGFLGYNKLAIDWETPIGAADSLYGGEQDGTYANTYPWNPASDPIGLLALSEFCTDCHDGAAGASTQGAFVQVEHGLDNYLKAYSHDAQPRH